MKYFWGVGYPSNKPFDLSDDLDHDQDPGIFDRIFTATG